MRSAFVGLVSHQGLETLLPENVATCRWSRNAARLRPRACVWAVLDPRVAAGVIDLLTDGEALDALRFLSLAAESIGPLMPTDGRVERGD
jgi:hypothetical protein